MALSFFKKPECEICRNPNAKDVLVTPVLGGKATRQKVCRVHFLDGYKKAFTAHPFKMVVTYPILDTWNSTYGFYSVSEMKAYAYQDDDVTMVKKLLALIPAGQECAFFGLEPSKKATLEHSWQTPAYLRESEAEFMSKEEACRHVSDGLAVRQRNFDDGFTVPYGGEGVFLTSLL